MAKLNETIKTTGAKEIADAAKDNSATKSKSAHQEVGLSPNELLEQLNMAREEMEKMRALYTGINVGMNYNGGQSDREISVGCRLIGGIQLISEKGDYVFSIKMGEVKKIRENKLKLVFENSKIDYMKYFSADVMYFTDAKEYSALDVEKKFDLSDDALMTLVKLPIANEMVGCFAELTNNKRSDFMVHTIAYRIGMLCAEDKLSDWRYENRAGFEEYFGVKVDTLIHNLQVLKNVPR